MEYKCDICSDTLDDRDPSGEPEMVGDSKVCPFCYLSHEDALYDIYYYDQRFREANAKLALSELEKKRLERLLGLQSNELEKQHEMAQARSDEEWYQQMDNDFRYQEEMK